MRPGILEGRIEYITIRGAYRELAGKKHGEEKDIKTPLLTDSRFGKVVCEMCVDDIHSDIVGYYDFFDGVDIRVIEDDRLFVSVNLPEGGIVVENGSWHISYF